MPRITKIEPKIQTPVKMKRVCAYARVSMDSERMRHSLSAQISYYSDFIQRHSEWKYVGVFADYGISGTETAKRDEFNRMLAECEAGNIDIILTKSIQRFARNTVDLLNIVRRLKELGVEVRFEKENINSLSGDGELMLAILASFAQEESRSISENCKWGIRKLYEKGVPRRGKIYGYRVKNGAYVIKEDEAEIVRRIFQMFLDGDSCYAIELKLEAEGVKSYTGKKLCCEVISNMIRQEKYTGCTLCQKFYNSESPAHTQTKNNGELPMYFIEDTHPAIISKETFKAAQEEFAKRYCVEIVNGIAQSASYYYHKYAQPHPPHRSPQWSEERRKSRSEYFRTRESGSCRYDFSHFIECENCGGHLYAQLRHYADGTTEVRWVDVEHTQRNKNAPRPLLPRDSALKKQIAGCLGWKEFNADRMFELLKIITINVDVITLHFKNGDKKSFKYIPPKYMRKEKKVNN